MLYRPEDPNALLWDTWIYDHRGTYHLFHLVRNQGGAWDRLGHATSTDLIHWEAHEDIPVQEPGKWDGGPTLTGMVFPFRDGFAMTYGSAADGVERIGIMTSKDLFRWRKHPNNPVLLPKAPHYEDDPAEMALPSVAWRDAFVEWREDLRVFEALVSARVPQGDLMRRGCVARARSKDLVHWDHLPPLAAPMRWQDMEVPERFALAGRHYLLFSTAHSKGPDLNTPSRKRCSGTFYMVSDDPDGGYEALDDPLLMGSGEGRWDCYVGRVVHYRGTPLLYHHQCGPRPALAPPKRIEATPDGRLSLHYWSKLDALLGADLGLHGLINEPVKTGALPHGEWTAKDGVMVGRSSYGPSATLLAAQGANLQFRTRIEFRSAQKAGVLVRFDAKRGQGVGILLDRDGASLMIGSAQRMHSGVVKVQPHDVFATPLDEERSYDLKVVAGFEFYEVYLDDRLIFSSVLADLPNEGRCGLMVDSGEAVFSRIHARQWELSSPSETREEVDQSA